MISKLFFLYLKYLAYIAYYKTNRFYQNLLIFRINIYLILLRK